MKIVEETEMKCVALIPMKANSERVPGKNFKEFAGKPLYKHILDSLLSVRNIEKIVINTDARPIIELTGLAESDRILIRDRRDDLCGDFISMNEIIADDVASVHADCYLMTHTTNPLVSPLTISNALTTYQKAVSLGVNDSLFTVNKFQTRFYKKNGEAINHDPNNLIRTQDLEPWYEENSCLYIFSAESFRKTNARIGQDPLLFEIPKIQAIDIDTHEDWAHAEILAKSGVINA